MPETVTDTMLKTVDLERVLDHIYNWFPLGGYPLDAARRHKSTYTVTGGALQGCEGFLLPGQYYRIVGSIFNDGLHRFGEYGLTDETFTGEVWPLAIPKAVLTIAADVVKYDAENPLNDKVSESFGGYSYTRAGSASSGASSGSVSGGLYVYGARLNPYRRMCDDV